MNNTVETHITKPYNKVSFAHKITKMDLSKLAKGPGKPISYAHQAPQLENMVTETAKNRDWACQSF